MSAIAVTSPRMLKSTGDDNKEKPNWYGQSFHNNGLLPEGTAMETVNKCKEKDEQQ